MKKTLIYIGIGLIILTLNACEDDIEINGNHQPILNVHFMKDGSRPFWMIVDPVDDNAVLTCLHQTVDITDTVSSHRKVENAKIEIYSNDELITCIEPENELYTSEPWTPIEGKTYQVYGYANDYPVLTGECKIPYTVPINYIEYNYTLSNDEFNSFAEFEGFINITDPVDQNNFYYLNVIRVSSQGESIFKLQFLDPFIEEGNIFSDEFFNGKSHNIHFKPHPYYPIREGNLIFELWSISESYYNIFKSMYLYHYINHFDNYAEPVQFYSNVNNGLGVISASSVARDTIRIN